MTVFELTFTLISVILGLALANIAASLHRLALAGRRVEWAPEPILLTILITVIIAQVWLFQWFRRSLDDILVGVALLDVVRMMLLFFAAASCLPDPDTIGEERLSLKNYYYRTRPLSYGAIMVGLWLFGLAQFLYTSPSWLHLLANNLVGPALCALLILFRARWLHLGVLVLTIGLWALPTLTERVGPGSEPDFAPLSTSAGR